MNIHDFRHSSIIFTQLSLALCSGHIFLSCWRKSTAAFLGIKKKRTLQISFGNHPSLFHSQPCHSNGVHHPTLPSSYFNYPGLANWLGHESKQLILGESCNGSWAKESLPGTFSETTVGICPLFSRFLSIKIQ